MTQQSLANAGMSPRPKITEVRREEIVRAALEVISERGFQDTRLADIAERAGTSAPAVLYHFTAKDEILDAVVSLVEDRFYEGVEATLEQEVGPRARLVRLLESAARDDDGEETATMWKMWLEIWTRALHEPHAARDPATARPPLAGGAERDDRRRSAGRRAARLGGAGSGWR